MIQAIRAIGSIIRALEKSFLVEMWNLMKKAREIGAPKKKRSMISFIYLKRKSKRMKFTKSLPLHLHHQQHHLTFMKVHHHHHY